MSVRVLLVDDSAVIRGLMSKALSRDSSIEIVEAASSGEMAIGMASKLKPDVITLDVEMPGMNGLDALPLLLKASPSSKVIIVSTLTKANASISLKALSLGATDYLMKPSSRDGNEVDVFYRDLIAKVKALGKSVHLSTTAAIAKAGEQVEKKAIPKIELVSYNNIPLSVSGVRAIAIASSTGGPQALVTLFESLKGHLLKFPIFLTQHMPPTFTTLLAENLTKISGRPCIEVKGGEVVDAGNIYLAPGDYHMVAEKGKDDTVVIKINQEAPENFCRPAADPMIRSLSKIYSNKLVVLVLTGMGQDGYLGSKIAVENGASVIAQDEASCVVYGMPKAVVENKLCRAVLPLNEIGGYLIKQIEGR
ncbi:MAG: chemotaxis response regulator protein-glutamate methylesterase [Rickettsiales bacterium]